MISSSSHFPAYRGTRFYYLYVLPASIFWWTSEFACWHTMNSATLINKYRISEACQLGYILRSCIAASYSGYIWSGHKIFHFSVIPKYGYACHRDCAEVRGQVCEVTSFFPSLCGPGGQGQVTRLAQCLHPLSHHPTLFILF